jgi:hypothetical protein
MTFNKDQIGWQIEQNNEDRHFISVGFDFTCWLTAGGRPGRRIWFRSHRTVKAAFGQNASEGRLTVGSALPATLPRKSASVCA